MRLYYGCCTIFRMCLPDKAVKEFIEIFEKQYGKKLSMEEGRESAQNLIDLMYLLLKTDKKQKEKTS